MPNTPKVQLGHVVLYVRDMQRSIKFYNELVGLQLCGEIFAGRATLLSGGSTHHELLLIEVGDAPGPLTGHRIGLYHIGWKVGESLAELKSVYKILQQADYPITGLSDHTISQSIYLLDPDGNEIELYVDNPAIDWRHDTSWQATPVKPLKL